MRRVVAITGGRGDGKTTALQRLADGLRAAGLLVGGVVQPVVHAGHERLGYDVLDLATGQRLPLARRGAPDRPDGCGFEFAPDAWAWAARRIGEARRECDVLVVDELGYLEAAGAGHLPALVEAEPAEHARLWLLGVRRETALALEARLGAFAFVIEPAADQAELLGRLVRLAGG
ncbi:MAG: DUF2478 domain-containing protein [Gemmatimonadales bacterium]|nr:DUF2478 domain-containing protein [Gemmatimonadales bacterium]